MRSKDLRASYADANRKSYDTAVNIGSQHFLKPSGQLVDVRGIQKARNIPRDGRIAACGSFFTVVGCDGAVRLYDTEASIGIAFRFCFCFCFVQLKSCEMTQLREGE